LGRVSVFLRVSPSPCLRVFFVLVGVVSAGEPLAGAGYRGKTVSQWAGDLGEKDLGVRWYATYALGRIGPDAAAAIPALERILGNLDEHEYVRGGAAWALGRMGPKAAPAVPLLVRTLSSKHVSVRRNAAQALGNLAAVQQPLPSGVSGEGQGARERGVSNLLKLLDDEDSQVRVAAAVALWKIQPSPRATAALEAMLRGGEPAACQAAVALGELGEGAREAVPALVAALGHSDEDTRRAAAAALGRIGPGAIPALRDVLATADEKAKREAVEALGWIGAGALSALVEALGDPSPPVRRSAARALGRLGPVAKDAVPALLRSVSDPQPEVRDTAAGALRTIRGS